jgi:hypothetical protein
VIFTPNHIAIFHRIILPDSSEKRSPLAPAKRNYEMEADTGNATAELQQAGEAATANATELQQAVLSVMTRHAASRSANTIKQYKRKQNDFTEWCATKKFVDGSLVYESKLVDYLDNYVIPRGNKRKKAEDGTSIRLGYEAVDAYVKVIIDLYQFQKSMKMSQHPHPRGKALKALMDMLRRS